MTPVMAGLLSAGALASLAWLHLRGVKRTRGARAAYMSEAMALIDNSVVTQTSIDYPTIEGLFAGRKIRIEPHLDIIALRKLPSLWMMVTAEMARPVEGTLSVMMRPRNLEYWSPFGELGIEVATPSGWPEHAHIRAGTARATRLLDVVEHHADFLRDPRGKEILVTGRHVRLTWLAAEGDRARYLVTRQASFEGATLTRDNALALLQRAVMLAEAIQGAEETFKR